jgi:hypothetical protein
MVCVAGVVQAEARSRKKSARTVRRDFGMGRDLRLIPRRSMLAWIRSDP